MAETVWQDGQTGFPGMPAQPGYYDGDGKWVPPTPALPAEVPDLLQRYFVTDANGTVLRKYQQGNELKQLVVAGQVISSYGKGTDPNRQLNAQGQPNYIDQGSYSSFTGIDNRNAGGAGSYTVQAGDTLRRLALGTYGDASMWYRIADANGLSALSPDTELTAGMKLSIPNAIGARNTSDTFKPYDAGAPAGVRNLLPSPRLHDFLKFEPQFSAGLDAIHRRFR